MLRDIVKVNNQQTGMSVELVEEMRTLYLDIKSAMETAYQKALRLGEMLVNAKGILPHGEFTSWIEEKMNFSHRLARSYMMIFERKEELKDKAIESIAHAFRLLNQSKWQSSAVLESGKPQIENKIPRGIKDFEDVEFTEANERDDDVISNLYQKIEEIEKANFEQIKENARLKKELEDAEFIKKEKENTIAAIRGLKDVKNLDKEKFEREYDETLHLGKKIIEARKYFQEQIYLIQGATLNPIACEAMKRQVEPLLKVMNEWMDAVRKRYGIKD